MLSWCVDTPLNSIMHICFAAQTTISSSCRKPCTPLQGFSLACGEA